MSKDAIWIVLACWFASTIIGPLVMSSLDRLYSEKIDFAVLLSIKLLKATLNRTIQVIIVVFLLPQLLFVLVISRVKSTSVHNFLQRTKMNELTKELFRNDFSTIKFIKFFYSAM